MGRAITWTGVDDGGGASLSGNVEVGFCQFDTSIDQFYGWTYTIRDDSGRLIDITTTFELRTELGLLGVIIDPLVLQVPADTANVVATFNDAGIDEPLVVTETTSFQVTPGVEVTSEAGTKFLILELPDAAAMALPPGPRSPIDFSLAFTVGDPANLLVKPMFTARVDQAGVRYYVPVFPCVTDFALIPASQIPIAAGFQFLNPTFAPLVANAAQFVCDQVVYDFTTPPTATPAPTPTPTVPPATPLPTATLGPTPTPLPTPAVSPTTAPPPATVGPTAPKPAFTG